MEHEKDNLKQEAETTKPEEAKTAAAEEAAPEAAPAAEKEPVKDDKRKRKRISRMPWHRRTQSWPIRKISTCG